MQALIWLIVVVAYSVLLLTAGFGLAHQYYATSMDHGRLNLNQALHVHQHNYSGSLWFLQKSASALCSSCLCHMPLANLVLLLLEYQSWAASVSVTWPCQVTLSHGPASLFCHMALPPCLCHWALAVCPEQGAIMC